MLRRLACLSTIAAVLSGCLATVSPPIGDNESELAQLRAENKGMILIRSSLDDGSCLIAVAQISQPDAAGRYTDGKDIYLGRPPIKTAVGPSEIVLAAGDYGIVQLRCWNPPKNQIYGARAATNGSILTGEETTYQPIAKFTVRAGEFVEVGSINLEFTRGPVPYGRNGEFATTVTPIEESWLRPLASAKPKIYALRVQHLMTTSGSVQRRDTQATAPDPVPRPPSAPSGVDRKG